MKKPFHINDEVCSFYEMRNVMFHYLSTFVKNNESVDLLSKILKNTKATFKMVFIAVFIFKKTKKNFCIFKNSSENTKPKMYTRENTNYEFIDDNNELLMLISFILASKTIDDWVITNYLWAQLTEYSKSQLSSAEISVIKMLNWEVTPNKEEFRRVVSDFSTRFNYAEHKEEGIRSSSKLRRYLSCIFACFGAFN